MSYVRRDIFTGAYVIVSELRETRPVSFSKAERREAAPIEVCPFCPGNEKITPVSPCDPDDNWRIRYFLNKYPALTENLCAAGAAKDDSYGFREVKGIHEIFVDTRNHYEDLTDFSPEHIEYVINKLKERCEYYRKKENIKYVQIFKNNGADAGATQRHSHWQIISGEYVPGMQQTLLNRVLEHKKETGLCLYCQVVEKELSEGQRLVYENSRFAVLTPYASRFTYESWIIPKKHVSTFSGIDKDDVHYLADALKRVLLSFRKIRANIDYNILLMDAPKQEGENEYHWHIQVFPRLGTLAGYEFSTGTYINHISPERAAKILKD